MDERAVEEENVAGLHDHGDELRVVGKRQGDVGEALARIGSDRAEDRPVLAAGEDLEAAVLLVAAIERHPGGDARTRLHSQVVLILMDSLAACARRLEVQHRLHRERLQPVQKHGQRSCQPRLE